MTKSITVITFIALTSYISILSEVFNSSDIVSEVQIFPIKEKVKIDSIEVEFFSKNVNDTIEITLFKDKNFFRDKKDPIKLYKGKIYSTNKGINKQTISFNDFELILEREELYFEFSSLGTSKLLTSISELDQYCDSVIVDRVQYYETITQKVLGRSTYNVRLFSSELREASNTNKKEIIGFDSLDSINSRTNIVVVDIDEDDYPDIILNNRLYLNNNGESFIKSRNLFDDLEGYIYVLDLNNDGILDFIKLMNGKLEVKSINKNIEIQGILNIGLEQLSIGDIKNVKTLDYNIDGMLDLVIEKRNFAIIVINQYPNFNIIKIKKDVGTNVCISNTERKIYYHNQNFLQDSKLLRVPSEYGFYLNDNERVSFSNRSGDSVDLIKLYKGGVNSNTLKRRILAPYYYYSIPTTSSTDYFIVSSSCECEPNYIFKKEKDKIIDYTEKSDLKFLNLQNSVFVDMDNDGLKDVFTIDNQKLNFYSLDFMGNRKNIKFTSNKNETIFFNKTTKEQHYKESNLFFGLNQVFGQIEISEEDISEGDEIRINNESFKYVDSKLISYNVDQNIQLQITPNPFSKEVNFTSNNLEIKEISIYSLTGRLVFQTEVLDQAINWNGTSMSGEVLSQGSYYFKISYVNSDIVETGNIIKAE